MIWVDCIARVLHAIVTNYERLVSSINFTLVECKGRGASPVPGYTNVRTDELTVQSRYMGIYILKEITLKREEPQIQVPIPLQNIVLGFLFLPLIPPRTPHLHILIR